eukprot:COSAG06_NODE_394_length_16313_cov_11.756568_4_plen_82_part_00
MVLEVHAQQLAVAQLRFQRVVVARALGWLVGWLLVSLPSGTPSSGSETSKRKAQPLEEAKARQEQEPTPRRAGEQSPNVHT